MNEDTDTSGLLTVDWELGVELEQALWERPEKGSIELDMLDPYPFLMGGEPLAHHPASIKAALDRSLPLYRQFVSERTSDTAVLVGNGPSLLKTDMSALEGQDVYITNYAVKNAELAKHAKAVAVSNYLVAEQDPAAFRELNVWKVFPVWLSHILPPDPQTIYLNAQGGELRFSTDVTSHVFWHSTVSFFWLQILYSAGYRKVCMIGFDNTYQQPRNLREGDIVEQKADDANHFDASYFKGKKWQAADTGKMAETYEISRKTYEADGREIVNCTVGGALEVFRRGDLAEELAEAVALPMPERVRTEKRTAVVARFDASELAKLEDVWTKIDQWRASDVAIIPVCTDACPLTILPDVIEHSGGDAELTERLQHQPFNHLYFADVSTLRTMLETYRTTGARLYAQIEQMPTRKIASTHLIEALSLAP